MRVIDKEKRQRKVQHGFSLLELIVAVSILTTVIAVVTDGIMDIEKKSASDVNKVGLAQESRQFMDQILRDLRQAGFPSMAMFDAPTLPSYASYIALTCDTAGHVRCCTLDNNVACGLISFTSAAIQFEGDIDGSGVSEVYLQVVPATGSCPCIVQRGTVLKSVGGTPAYYTELDNVMSQNIFTAYNYNGTAWDSTSETVDLIKNIGVTLYVQSPQPDLNQKSITYPTTTMVSAVRINN
jgi:prepilin-type N-terminal cleavage/methylation domain-containing protein